jgi:hypothetical protein
MAQGIASRGEAQASLAAPSGVAAQFDISAIVCPRILAIRAQVIAQLEGLAATFPAYANLIRSIEAQAVGQIDAIAAQFGCRGPSH